MDEIIARVNLNNDFKLVDKALSCLDVPLDDYPQLKMRKIMNSVSYFYSATKRSKTDSEYKSLWKVEELFYGLTDCLVMLVSLVYKKNKMQAKGIYQRNKLTLKDFEEFPLDTAKMA